MFCRNADAGRLQHADRRFGEGGEGAEQGAEDQDGRRVRAAGHEEADVLGKGHQAALDAFHEEHQAEHHGADAEGDGFGFFRGRAQGQRLEADQHQRQRHHRPYLLGEAHRDVRRQQAMQVNQPQLGAADREGALGGEDIVVTDLPVATADGTEVLAVADVFFGHGSLTDG